MGIKDVAYGDDRKLREKSLNGERKRNGRNASSHESRLPWKEPHLEKTVLETDTGGWVRNALRLKEN